MLSAGSQSKRADPIDSSAPPSEPASNITRGDASSLVAPDQESQRSLDPADALVQNSGGGEMDLDHELDPLDELAAITEGLRQYLKWQAIAGTTGIPRDTQLAARLRENPLPDFSDIPTREQRPETTPREPVSPQKQSTQRAKTAEPSQPTRLSEDGDFAPLVFDDAPKKPSSLRSRGARPPTVSQVPSASPLVALGRTQKELAEKISNCRACDLHSSRKTTVFSRGNGTSGICFVGDAPGEEDETMGEPFLGPAGQLLDKMITAMGLTRDEVYVCNVIKCRPPEDRHASRAEMSKCHPYLERQIELLDPQIIVALGGAAVSGLLGLNEGITKIRGRFRLYQGRLAVMPTFHPAYLLRNASAKSLVWKDLRQVLHHVGRSLPEKD